MRFSDYNGLGDVVRHYAKVRPNSPAIIFCERSKTYADLNEASDRVAAGLLAAGLNNGDRVSYLGKNSDLFFEVLFGVSKAGGIFCPLNWRLTRTELDYIINDCESSMIFVEAQFLSALDDPVELGIETLIVMDGREPNHLQYADWIAAAETEIACPQVGRDDDALLMYTSGTTGKPKGAVLTNRNLAKHCDLEGEPTPEWWRSIPDDVGLLTGPTFHIGPLEFAFRLLFSGATIVLHREFDAGEMIAGIEQQGVTITAMVPAGIQMLVNHPSAKTADFSSLKMFYYGASPIPLDLLKEALRIFQCRFTQGYGMTESTSTIATLPPSDHVVDGSPRMLSCGIPLVGVEIRTVDRAGKPLPSGVNGEVQVRGDCVMRGYWNNSEATQEAITKDGWLNTGDAGYIDDDGYLFIRDRIKDVIISGGENVYPAEVESVLFEHPKVKEVSVIGVPDERWGETVLAVIVPQVDEQIACSEIVDWARSRLAGYKLPKFIKLVDELPRTQSGKVQKGELRKMSH